MDGVNLKVKEVVKSSFLHILLMSIALMCLFPLFWMVRCSFMTNDTVFVDKGLIPKVINSQNFINAWAEGGFGTYFLNSLLYTSSVCHSYCCYFLHWQRMLFRDCSFPERI